MGNVLDPLLARKVERQVEFAPQMIVGGSRDQDTSRGRELLQARRDIYAVSKQVFAGDYNVAEVYADAENDPALGWHGPLIESHLFLYGDGGRDRIDNRPEFDNLTIAHQLDDAAPMLGDDQIDDFSAEFFNRGKRTALVGLYQT